MRRGGPEGRGGGMRLYNCKQLYKRRKRLRNQSTSAEIQLWHYLKYSQLGVKFRRQHSVGPYILDFYCPSRKLAVELDGSAHDHEQAFKYDFKRTKYLEQQGIVILIFENRAIFENIQGVVDMIRMHNAFSPPRLRLTAEPTPPIRLRRQEGSRKIKTPHDITRKGERKKFPSSFHEEGWTAGPGW